MPSREVFNEWFDRGYNEGYTHMLVCCDEFEEEDGSYPVYVNDHYQDLQKIIAERQMMELNHVHEVYALWKNRDRQTAPARITWFDGPSPRPKGTSILSCGCAVPWKADHTKTKVLTCKQHGLVVIDEIR